MTSKSEKNGLRGTEMNPSSLKGSLTLIFSCMRGGKTTYLLHHANTLAQINKVLFVNNANDIRPDANLISGTVTTHNSIISQNFSNSNIKFISVRKLCEIESSDIESHSVICIDEAQFFTDLVNHVIRWVDELNKEIFVAALNGDSNRKLFGSTHELLPHISHLIHLSDCYCQKCLNQKALFSARIKDDGTGGQIQIGVSNYKSLCRECMNLVK